MEEAVQSQVKDGSATGFREDVNFFWFMRAATRQADF